MKKILMLILMTVSFSALADMSPECKILMDDRIDKEKEMVGLINQALESGEITAERAQERIEDLDILAEMTAAVCSIYRLAKAQNSVRGKLGLTSAKRADRLSERESQAAMDYYLANRGR